MLGRRGGFQRHKLTGGQESICSAVDDPSMNVDDVQRQLDAVKTERKRRMRRELHRLPPPQSTSSVTRKSSTSFPVDPALSTCSVPDTGEALPLEVLEPYRPLRPFPTELLRRAYICGLHGECTLDPNNHIGDLVASVDLSPWSISEDHVELLVQNR